MKVFSIDLFLNQPGVFSGGQKQTKCEKMKAKKELYNNYLNSNIL